MQIVLCKCLYPLPRAFLPHRKLLPKAQRTVINIAVYRFNQRTPNPKQTERKGGRERGNEREKERESEPDPGHCQFHCSRHASTRHSIEYQCVHPFPFPLSHSLVFSASCFLTLFIICACLLEPDKAHAPPKP